MYYYTAYGFSFASEQPIPGLVPLPSGSPADVSIKLGRLPSGFTPAEFALREPRYVSPYRDANGTPTQRMWEGGDGYFFLLYCEGISFVVDRAGREIWASWPDRYSLGYAALYLRGPVMGFVMALRGLVCLHASAVVIDGRAVGFAGPAGFGKSTTAAAFVRRGFAALSDDILAISANGGGFVVQPSYPRLCLWPESAAVLGPSVEALPRVIPEEEKRYIQLKPDNGSFHDKPAPLGAIYILSPKAAGSCKAGVAGLQGADELLSLLANNYGSGRLNQELRGMEFTVLGQIAGQVPIRRVHVPRGAPCAEELCDLILRDFRASLEKK